MTEVDRGGRLAMLQSVLRAENIILGYLAQKLHKCEYG